MNKLIDKFGRLHDYLRISVTDKCNLRCSYCMPAENSFLKSNNLMTADEIFSLAKIFVENFGIKKIRFTGGEPLTHPDFKYIISKFNTLNTELALTTNGILLDKYFELLQKSRINSLNISLDTLDKEKFKTITHRDYFERVINNIYKSLEFNYKVKLNTVILNNVNDNEVVEFVKLSLDKPLHIRFIEFMPFNGNRWHSGKVVTTLELLERIKNIFEIEKLEDEINSTSRNYRVKNAQGTFSFISTVSEPFCSTCNRLRLTADGKIRNCLFDQNEIDLLTPLRSSGNIEESIRESILNKFKSHGGLNLQDEQSKRSMIMIGG